MANVWKKVTKRDLKKKGMSWVDSEYFLVGSKQFILVYFDKKAVAGKRWVVASGTTVSSATYNKFRTRAGAMKFLRNQINLSKRLTQ